MQVALTQDASVALRVVHRPVGGIHMNKGVQTLLDIHTGTKGEGTTHDDTHFTTVHFVEDFKFLLDFHAWFHHDNLIFWNARFYKLLTNILIEIEPCRFVLIIVGKNGNGSVVVLGIFKTA